MGCKNIFKISFFTLLLVLLPQYAEAREVPVDTLFTTTAYYSPLPGQSFYYKGSYNNELMLNGLGKVTASGSSIYKGAIAVPSIIEFGSLIEVKNKGFFVAEDRGSAITDWGDSIRIDIWKGFGESSLREALDWGVRDIRGWIYPFKASNFETHIFNNNLNIGDTSDEVFKLQYQLKKLGFYDHAITGYYGDITADAVYNYQVFKGILSDRDFPGAGRLGPGTRRRLNFMNMSIDKLLENKKVSNIENPPYMHYKEMNKDLFSNTLAYGDTDYNVYILQTYLSRLDLFNWDRYTYQYLDVTKNAVLDFQLRYGIIDSPSDQGAGVFGPATRKKLKELV